MVEENISQKFKVKKIQETRNYFTEEINQIELINKKHKNTITFLSYIEHLDFLAFAVTGWFSISAFIYSVGVLADIMSTGVGTKIFAITEGIIKIMSQ